MRLPFYSRIVSTAIVLPLWFAVPPASADDNPQVAIETRLVSATDTYAQQLGIKLGLAIPTGEFADKTGTGFHLGLQARQQLTPHLAIGFQGGWSLFGAKDLTDQGFGEPKVMVTEIGPEIELILRDLRRITGHTTSLSDMQISIVGGVNVASLGVTQDLSAYDYPDAKSAETQPLAYVGPQAAIPVGEKGTLNVRGQYNHIFTGDGGEDWFSFWAGYMRDLNMNNYDRLSRRKDAWESNTVLGPFSTLSLTTRCGMPINDFHDVALPGLGLGVQGTVPITNAVSGVVGAAYQTYGTPGFQEDANDREFKSYEFDAGVQIDFRPTVNWPDGYIQLTVNPVITDFKEFPTPSDILSESGVFIAGGLGVRRRVTDRLSVAFLTDMPLVGMFFDNKQTKRVRSDLMIMITPRIIGG